MADSQQRSGKSLPAGDDPVITIRRSTGEALALTLNEYRLALLGLVDFEGDWEAMRIAASLVVDGPSKDTLIRERLLPVAPDLEALVNRGVDGLELLAARHWFRNGQM